MFVVFGATGISAPQGRHVPPSEPICRSHGALRLRRTTAIEIAHLRRCIACLTRARTDGTLRGFSQEMKVCNITGSKGARGSVIHRRGLAKKKGGVGRHITKMVPRIFAPNLRRQRIWVPELKKFVRIRVTARGLKTINKHGAYKALKKAGAI
jgi:large subunit ribosomal protein L28